MRAAVVEALEPTVIEPKLCMVSMAEFGVLFAPDLKFAGCEVVGIRFTFRSIG